jgi:hypothetical protein
MTKSKRARVARRAPAVTRSRPPRTWSPTMYLNPAGDTPGLTFSVLRRRLRDEEVGISASEFVRKKLYPVDLPVDGSWLAPWTCRRAEVLLPPAAVDAFADVKLLLEAYERYLPPWRQSLLSTLKIDQPTDEPLHASFERIRSAVRASIAIARRCPAIVISHAPFLSGSPRRPHCHVLILPAKLGLLGFTALNDELTSDAGHLTLYGEMREARAIRVTS